MFQKVLYRFGPDVPGAWAQGMAVVEQALALDRQDHRFHSWKGLLQLIYRPFYWEKTVHGLGDLDTGDPDSGPV